MGKSADGINLLAGAKRFWSWFTKKSPAFIVLISLSAFIVFGFGVGGTLAATGVFLNSFSSQSTEAEEEPAVIDPYDEAIAAWGQPDLAAILSESFPDAEWSLNGNSYAGLNWIGPGPKPTEAELRALWVTVGKVLADRRVAAEEERAKQQAEEEAAQQARAADPISQELCRSIDYKALYGPGVDYTKVLSVHYPGAQWSLNGSAYSGLTWISPGAQPTQAELDALWDGVAFQLCLQKPISELQARAGTSETNEYVDGILRPKGFSDGTFTPTLANCNTLPQVPSDGGGGTVGTIEMAKYPEMDLGEIGCRIAEAHGWFGGQYSMGVSINGCCTFGWYSSQVNGSTVRSVLASIGVMASQPTD